MEIDQRLKSVQKLMVHSRSLKTHIFGWFKKI